MKKFLLSSVALLGLSTVAMAADLPRRQAAPVFTPVPIFTWTGFYIGVNAGYGFADTDSTNSVFLPGGSVLGSVGTNGTLTFNDRNDDEDGGFVGGGQIGYNYQIGTFVIGFETDFQYADLSGNNGRSSNQGYTFAGTPGLAFAPPAATVSRNGTSSLESFGTVRGRVGLAFDRTLVYATGGFAYGFSDGGDEFCGFFNGGCNGGDDTRFGYTVGGGLEYAFTNNVTAKIEGLYVNLDESERRGRATYDLGTNRLFLANDNNGGDSDFFVVRAGLNFKFSAF